MTLVQEQEEEKSDGVGKGEMPDIKAVLAHVLGVAVHELEDEAELECMGLDSLTSIEALQALKEEYGLSLPSSFFETYTTLNAVKAYISSQLKVKVKTKTKTSSKGGVVNYERLSKLMRLDTVPVKIQSSTSAGNTLPLFLIHDGSGLVK